MSPLTARLEKSRMIETKNCDPRGAGERVKLPPLHLPPAALDSPEEPKLSWPQRHKERSSSAPPDNELGIYSPKGGEIRKHQQLPTDYSAKCRAGKGDVTKRSKRDSVHDKVPQESGEF